MFFIGDAINWSLYSAPKIDSYKNQIIICLFFPGTWEDMDSRRDFSALKQVCWNFEHDLDPDQIFFRTQESNRSRHLLFQMQEGWESLQSASGCSLNIHDFINIHVWSVMKVWYLNVSHHLQWDNILYRQARVRSQVPSAEPVNVVWYISSST